MSNDEVKKTLEEGVSRIDWEDTPLDKFYLCPLSEEDEKTMGPMVMFPPGDAKAHKVLTGLLYQVECTFVELIARGDYNHFAETGEVPVIRNGKRGYELLEKLTLRDLPAVLDTFVVLEEEREKEKRKEAERKSAERKKRKRVLARERRKREKLGEWH